MFKAKGFPCRLVGEPLAMSNGCIAVAAMIDFRELVLINTVKRPEFTKWFTQYQSTLSRLPQQQLELYSRLGASA
jgi:hypothetical protein